MVESGLRLIHQVCLGPLLASRNVCVCVCACAQYHMYHIRTYYILLVQSNVEVAWEAPHTKDLCLSTHGLEAPLSSVGEQCGSL